MPVTSTSPSPVAMPPPAEPASPVAEPVEAMNVWKIVKNRLPFFGTLPFLRMLEGSMRTKASSGKALKAL